MRLSQAPRGNGTKYGVVLEEESAVLSIEAYSTRIAGNRILYSTRSAGTRVSYSTRIEGIRTVYSTRTAGHGTSCGAVNRSVQHQDRW